jgi:NAD+ diphosphatase
MLYEFDQLNWTLTSGYLPPEDHDAVIVVCNRDVVSLHNQYFQTPTWADIKHLITSHYSSKPSKPSKPSKKPWQVARYKNKHWYVIRLDDFSLLKQHLPEVYLKEARDAWTTSESAFALVARALMVQRWLEQNKFCGQCGQATSMPDQTELYTWCDSCRLRFYPRINPCAIGLIYRRLENGEFEILMARGPRQKEGRFALLAGFMEAGESGEQTLAREVLEESGVNIKNIRYVNSQTWPYPHQLMLGYTAEYNGTVHKHDDGTDKLVPQAGEILELRWFKQGELTNGDTIIPPKESIAGFIIDQFLKGELEV